MKTTFGRLFSVTALVLVFTLLLMGLSFFGILRSYLLERQQEELTTNARTVANLAAGYAVSYSANSYSTSMHVDMDLYLNMVFGAQISDTDILLCDTAGRIYICSCQTAGCAHRNQQLPEDYVNSIRSDREYFRALTLTGIYEEPRYCAGRLFTDQDGNVLGIVVASQAIDDASALLSATAEMLTTAGLSAMALSVIICAIYTRNMARPLRDLAQAAREFGHGDLTVRIKSGSGNTEELDEVAIAFNNMAVSLEQSEYRRQEFVANISHELKTPMTTISGYVDGVLDGTIPPELAPKYLTLVSQETKRLSRLVRSMLDISRLQGGSIPVESMGRFDVGECLGQVLISFESAINRKNIDVQVDFPEYPVYARGVLDSITQVVYNLVDNAVKFCPQEGTLSLSLDQQNDKVYVHIANTGETIPPDELPLVFDRFHKIDKSRSLNRDSWGLGLYIVKTIICSHGEDIFVQSRDGRTEFTFTLTQVHSLS